MKAWSAAKLEFSGTVKNYFNEINLFFLMNNAFEGYSIDVDNKGLSTGRRLLSRASQHVVMMLYACCCCGIQQT